MKELHELKERLMDELKDYGRKDMSGSNLEVIDKLTHTIKNLCKIIESEDESYSGHYMPWAYDDGTRSYTRRRDSMGRYAGTGYSRDDLTDKLRDLLKDAPDERIRAEIRRLIDKM